MIAWARDVFVYVCVCMYVFVRACDTRVILERSSGGLRWRHVYRVGMTSILQIGSLDAVFFVNDCDGSIVSVILIFIV